jgi:anti-anti-sigma factor
VFDVSEELRFSGVRDGGTLVFRGTGAAVFRLSSERFNRSSDMALTVDITKGEAGTYRVKLGGSLDTDTSPQFDKQMEGVWADPKARAVRLELYDLTYISSMGLGSLAKVRKMATGRGGALVTVGAQPQIARVFEIVKMLPKETVFVNHEEADAYLAAIEKQVVDQLRGE